ncbi:MAG TPA: alpha-amylase family glycosyl hydrolase [Vicinamibacterales bacterium]|nr:alpha-amylase family glycosyl hydrolase [Vicinamibacterales bacterium]
MSRPHPHLLEISAWPWLARLSAQAGRTITLANVPEAVWDGISAQGFDQVYLMGVWERSALGRELARTDKDLRGEYDRVLPGWTDEDVPGSPYCISAYVPDARMGGWAGLDATRAALHARRMELIVDFVPNHTGFDHAWVRSHPDRYVLGDEGDIQAAPEDFRRVGGAIVACGRDPYFAPWRDVAQLNYFNPDTRAGMTGVLREIASHADGVRCDMAMLVLNDVFERTWRRVLRDRWPMPADEFWPGATAAVPTLTFLAEVYWDLEWTLQQQGFDFTYDKRLLDRLHGSSAHDVRGHLQAEGPFRDRLARFLENHDEARSAAQLPHRLSAAATMLATLPGMRFYFDGQMDGARLRAPVQLGRWPEEPASPQVRDMYGRLLKASDDDLFHAGDWQLLGVQPAGDGTSSDLIAWQWLLGDRLAVGVANLGAGSAQGHVQLPHLPPGDAWDFEDQLTSSRHRWDRQSIDARGLYVRLDPGAAHLLIPR